MAIATAAIVVVMVVVVRSAVANVVVVVVVVLLLLLLILGLPAADAHPVASEFKTLGEIPLRSLTPRAKVCEARGQTGIPFEMPPEDATSSTFDARR